MRERQNKRENYEKRSLVDYREYSFSKKEMLSEIGKGLVLLSVTSVLFYGSIWGVILLSPYLYVHIRIQKNKYKKQRQEKLQTEFKDGMVALVTALHAGYSMENALKYVKKELEKMESEGVNFFVLELEDMIKKIEIKIPVEELFLNLALRSGLEEIDLFAAVLVITKREGGNLIKIIHKTVDHLSKKVQVDHEIAVLITGKKLEKNIMCVMPYFVILYMNLTNGDYMSSMYGNLIGIVLMSVCLILVFVSYYWADKLIKIGV